MIQNGSLDSTYEYLFIDLVVIVIVLTAVLVLILVLAYVSAPNSHDINTIVICTYM